MDLVTGVPESSALMDGRIILFSLSTMGVMYNAITRSALPVWRTMCQALDPDVPSAAEMCHAMQYGWAMAVYGHTTIYVKVCMGCAGVG